MLGKIFRSIALMMHPVGATTNCDIIVHSSLNLLQNSSNVYGNVGLNEPYISVLNLKEIETWEGYFYAT